MARPRRTILRRRAIQLNQNAKHPLFMFSLTGKDLERIADISRISRGRTGKLLGYQRPEVKRHVGNIVDYLDGEDVLFPNSIILAFSSSVKFIRSRGPNVSDGLADAGTLEIPLSRSGAKPGWIVDGQQRAMAIWKSKRQELPIPVTAFVADDVDLQRDQFLRINSAKPLPRGLITELLPTVSTLLPPNLAARRIPSALCDQLNEDPDSPFVGMIKRASTDPNKSPKPHVNDNSIVKMLGESLSSPSGCLFPHRNIATGETNFDAIRALLFTYWTAVKKTFPNAWGKPPTQSRLMHSVGILAMGRLMDRIMTPRINPTARGAVATARKELKRIAPACRWTSGRWEGLDGLKWNEVQNTTRHIRLLSNHLVRLYVHGQEAEA